MDSLETPQEPPSVSLLLCKRLCWHKQKGQSSTETSLPFQTPAIFEHLLLVQCWVCSTPRHSGLRRSRRVLVQTSVPRGIPWDWGGVSFGRSNNYSFFGGCGFWSHLGVKCTCCWAGFWWKGSFVLLGAGASKRERERSCIHKLESWRPSRKVFGEDIWDHWRVPIFDFASSFRSAKVCLFTGRVKLGQCLLRMKFCVCNSSNFGIFPVHFDSQRGM